MPSSQVVRTGAAVGLVLLLTVTVLLAVDLDDDGVRTARELAQGTRPLDPDTDGDGLHDGAEAALGTDPRDPDTDGDGLLDGEERRRGSDPLRTDTDLDGIPDAEEPEQDCDGDGYPAIASSDDDSDQRPDGEEPEAHRCRPDVDGDGVLDGLERHPDCIERPDCDGDGLPDAQELATQYDMLRADTFGIGLPDAVAYAFQQRGQDPTPDLDKDGIPDGWEGPDGLIDWGPLLPQPGRRDLLIEYLRVVGPDSGRYSWLDFGPAYRAVAELFGGAGIHVQYTETVVARQAEHRPGFLATVDLPFYRSVLENGTASTNPYVTTVVLNPQQTQQHGSILGAAFLRSMIATIDYGAHTEIVFRDASGNQTVRVRPIVESQIIGGLSFRGYDDGGVLPDGRLYLHRPPQGAQNPGYTMSWSPDWFRTAPYYETDDGQASLQMRHAGAVLHTAELASTIAHELGHTLGLCHTHEPVCQAFYGGLTEQDIRASTMSYAAQQTTLHFLAQEWEALGEYLRCPPQETTALVARDAAVEDVLEAKYDSSFLGRFDHRECLELLVLEQTLWPRTEATLFRLPEVIDRGRAGAPMAMATTAAGALVAVVAGRWTWRRTTSSGAAPETWTTAGPLEVPEEAGSHGAEDGVLAQSGPAGPEGSAAPEPADGAAPTNAAEDAHVTDGPAEGAAAPAHGAEPRHVPADPSDRVQSPGGDGAAHDPSDGSVQALGGDGAAHDRNDGSVRALGGDGAAHGPSDKNVQALGGDGAAHARGESDGASDDAVGEEE